MAAFSVLAGGNLGMEILDDSISQDSGLASPHSKDDPFVPNFQGLDIDDKNSKIESIKQIEDSIAEISDNYDDEPDETLSERLWGLTEMFPDCVVNTTHFISSKTLSGIKHLYSFSRSAMWIIGSTSVILFAPVLLELEIAKIEEKQKSEQKQYLLGPSAAMLGSGSTPPMPR